MKELSQLIYLFSFWFERKDQHYCKYLWFIVCFFIHFQLEEEEENKKKKKMKNQKKKIRKKRKEEFKNDRIISIILSVFFFI